MTEQSKMPSDGKNMLGAIPKPQRLPKDRVATLCIKDFCKEANIVEIHERVMVWVLGLGGYAAGLTCGPFATKANALACGGGTPRRILFDRIRYERDRRPVPGCVGREFLDENCCVGKEHAWPEGEDKPDDGEFEPFNMAVKEFEEYAGQMAGDYWASAYHPMNFDRRVTQKQLAEGLRSLTCDYILGNKEYDIYNSLTREEQHAVSEAATIEECSPEYIRSVNE